MYHQPVIELPSLSNPSHPEKGDGIGATFSRHPTIILRRSSRGPSAILEPPHTAILPNDTRAIPKNQHPLILVPGAIDNSRQPVDRRAAHNAPRYHGGGSARTVGNPVFLANTNSHVNWSTSQLNTPNSVRTVRTQQSQTSLVDHSGNSKQQAVVSKPHLPEQFHQFLPRKRTTQDVSHIKSIFGGSRGARRTAAKQAKKQHQHSVQQFRDFLLDQAVQEHRLKQMKTAIELANRVQEERRYFTGQEQALLLAAGFPMVKFRLGGYSHVENRDDWEAFHKRLAELEKEKGHMEVVVKKHEERIKEFDDEPVVREQGTELFQKECKKRVAQGY
ncbi:hypothetical protein T439DRAFT_358721 [Meredithblackwellia eburnea MCA 4105]